MKIFNLCVVIGTVLIICAVATELRDDYINNVNALKTTISSQTDKKRDARGEKCVDGLPSYLNWSFNDTDGTLTISGNGDMCDFDKYGDTPWFRYVFRATKIVVSNGVTSIGKNAFGGLEYVTTVSIPSTVTYIGTDAFYSCDRLESFNVDSENTNYESPEGVLIYKTFGSLVKYPAGKTDTTYTISDSIKTIRSYAFQNCKYLQEMNMASTITTIEENAFHSCYGLTHIEIPSLVTTIPHQAFSYCNNLKTVSIPSGVTSISVTSFAYCDSLESFEVDPANTKYTSIDGVLIDYKTNTLVRYPSGKTDKEYSIPSNVTTLGTNSLSRAQNLTTVFIRDKMRIESAAFSSCPKLTTVLYQGSNAILQSPVFMSCNALENVCVPPDYTAEKFCDRDVTDSDTCKLFKSKFDHCNEGSLDDGRIISVKRSNATEWEQKSNNCYEYVCVNESGELLVKKRENATEWEEKSNDCYEFVCLNESEPQSYVRENVTKWIDKSNACYEYQCVNEGGIVWRSLCSNADGINRTCVNDDCVPDESLLENKWSVVIEVSGVKAADLDLSEVVDSIVGLSEIDKDLLTVGTRFDPDGNVTSIVIIVENEEMAKWIATDMDEMNC